MPTQEPLTQEQWAQMQADNPDQYGGYQAISGDQYDENVVGQQGWWQNVQQVGETGSPGSTLYGMPGQGDMPTTNTAETPQETASGNGVDYTYVQKGDNFMRIDKNNLGSWTDNGYTEVSEEQYNTGQSGDDIDVDGDSEEGEDVISEDEQALIDADEQAQLDHDQHLSELEEFANTMEENNQALIDDIKRSFAIRMRQMAQLNKMSLAGITKSGIRSGRQRYASEINTGIVTAEESAGIARLAELDAQEKSLILQAKMAMDEKSMEMLNERYALIKDRQAEKEALILNLRQISIQEEERNRAKMTFARQKEEWATQDANVRLEGLISSGVGLDNLNADEISSLENDLGMGSGTLQGFYEGLQAAQEAEAVGDSIALQKSIIDILNDVPEGMEITIGDSTYTGLKDTTTEYVYDEIVGGIKYKVAIDKETGEELYRKNAGPAYKPTAPKATPTEGSKIFSSQATKNRLLSAGFTVAEIDAMGEIIATDGLEAVIEMLKPQVDDTGKGYFDPNSVEAIPNWDKKVKTLRSIMSGQTSTQYNAPEEEILGNFIDAEFLKTTSSNVLDEDDLADIMKQVEKLRLQNYTDKQIKTTLGNY